ARRGTSRPRPGRGSARAPPAMRYAASLSSASASPPSGPSVWSESALVPAVAVGVAVGPVRVAPARVGLRVEALAVLDGLDLVVAQRAHGFPPVSWNVPRTLLQRHPHNDQITGTRNTATTPKRARIGSPSFQ